MVIVTQNTVNHLHCQLFRQRSAVTDTVQNAHHGGGTFPLVDDLLPTRSPTRQRKRMVVSRRQLTSRLAVRRAVTHRPCARKTLMTYSERAHELMMLSTCSITDSLLEMVTPSTFKDLTRAIPGSGGGGSSERLFLLS